MNSNRIRQSTGLCIGCIGAIWLWGARVDVQLTDQTQAPNAAGRGIALSLEQQVSAGQGDAYTPDTSVYIILRDPARAIRRGRQLFQRKFTMEQGLGPPKNDGIGNIAADLAIGAGLVDSCAGATGAPAAPQELAATWSPARIAETHRISSG